MTQLRTAPAVPETASSPVMDQFREHVRKATGISLSDAKASMIHQRLRRRVVEVGFQTTDDYLRQVMSARDGAEMVRAVDLITTNTTSFFREPQHFDFLAKRVVPEAIARRGRPRIKIWSAACSEGAEAYTAAMVLAEQQRMGQSFDYAILGTDISTRILDKANRAIFLSDQLEGIPADLRSRYVMSASDPAYAGRGRMVPELRRKVRFGQLNLMDANFPVDPDVTVVFLRNVLIYFDRSDQTRVVQNIARHIMRGGYLMVGHSESMVVEHPELRQVMPSVFQKV